MLWVIVKRNGVYSIPVSMSSISDIIISKSCS